MNYKLTRAAKRRLAFNFRHRLEVRGWLPSSLIANLQAYPRYKVLLDRWTQRVTGRTIAHWLSFADEGMLERLLRTLYATHFGTLPNQPLKPNPGVTPTHTIAPVQKNDGDNDSDGDGNADDGSDGGSDGDGNADDGNADDGETDGDSDPGRFENRDADGDNNDNGGGADGGRYQSEWSEEEERKLEKQIEKLNGQHNDAPWEKRHECNGKAIDEHLPKTNQLVGKVRQALQADARNRTSRFRDSGEIDMTRLPDIAQLTDVSTVYQRTRHGKKLNACVQVYIDESGSMDLNYAEGKPLMTIAATAAACLSKAMDQLQIPHQLLAYCRTPKLIKNWRGKWQNAHLRDIAPAGSTHVPNALEAGIPLMLGRREARKIAIVLTDGDMAANHSFWKTNGNWSKLKKQGVEVYAIGLSTTVLCPDAKIPSVDWWNCVGAGDVVSHYKDEDDYKRGAEPYKQTVGINGGIDNVQPETLVPQLAKHLVEVFTQGREVIR